jgi:hypothetical protein
MQLGEGIRHLGRIHEQIGAVELIEINLVQAEAVQGLLAAPHDVGL